MTGRLVPILRSEYLTDEECRTISLNDNEGVGVLYLTSFAGRMPER